MEFIHFGASNNKLLGVYSPSSTTDVNDSAVLLCYPFGQEYMRAHMAFRQLTSMLSRQGLPTMRFDYYGTGDSYGESNEIALSVWQENTRLAIEELKSMADCSQIYLVGLRLGAIVAATVAAARPDVKRLVLWDPIIQGLAYLEEIRHDSTVLTQNEEWQIHGYPMPSSFRDELCKVDLNRLSFPEKLKILQIVSSEDKQFEAFKFAHNHHVEHQHVPSLGDWNYVDNEGSILLPQKLVRSIVTWFSK
jgi:alpha/beta superfamily hydrolase